MNYKAFAKINLGLDVKEKREDGYHELHSIMMMTSLYDTMSFSESDEVHVFCDVEINVVDNLVYKVIRYLQQRYEIKKGITVNIKKNIPLGGGLGGGSSDAAVAIKALNKIWDLRMSEFEMYEVGKKFGADIPYCIYGLPAFVSGIGEKITPLMLKMKFQVIIVKLPYFVETREVFLNMKREDYNKYDIAKVKEAFETNNYELLLNNLGNNMETYTIKKHPEIGAVKEMLIEYGCFTSIMSGSGSTVLGLINQDASNCVEKIRKSGYEAWICEIIKQN